MGTGISHPILICLKHNGKIDNTYMVMCCHNELEDWRKADKIFRERYNLQFLSGKAKYDILCKIHSKIIERKRKLHRHEHLSYREKEARRRNAAKLIRRRRVHRLMADLLCRLSK